MGNIKYGPLAQEVAGTVGGVTFARSYTSKTVRGWRAPVDKRRTAQITQRQIMAYVTGRWYQFLSQDQRDAWDLYAPSCPFTNSLGETYHLNGFNMFVRNLVIQFVHETAIIYDAPTLTGFPTAYTLGWTLTHATGVLEWTSITPAPTSGDYVLLEVHSIRPVTKNFPFLQIVDRSLWLADTELPVTVYTYGELPTDFTGKLMSQTRHYYLDFWTRISTPVFSHVISE